MNLINQDYIFLSYSHKDSIKEYITALDNLGYNVLYDEEMSVGTDWELKARRYISSPKCKGIIMFLSSNSVKSKAILRELEISQRYNKPLFPLVLNGNSVGEIIVDTVSNSKNENESFIAQEIGTFFTPDIIYITAQQFFDDAYQQKMIKTFNSWGMSQVKKNTKIHSTYTSERKDEFSRLKQQQRLFLEFDKKVISDLVGNIEDKVFLLDIGCNDGDLIMNRVDGSDNISVVGVDINMPAINRGNEKYPEEKFMGYCIDCLDDEIINISMADGLSGTYQSACGAREMVDNKEKITVINSKTLCGPHRYLVEKAQKMKIEGHSAKDIIAWLEKAIETAESFLIPQDFDFLRRGGRLTSMAATFGSVLKLKPIMTQTQDGKRLDKFAVKRTMKAAVGTIIEHLKKKGVDKRHILYVSHANAIEDAKKVIAQLKETFGDVEIHMLDLGAAFVTQGGPKCVAIQYIEK